MVIYRGDSFIGTGSILAPTVVLAPAHILSSDNAVGLQIRAGEFDAGSTVEQYPSRNYTVADVIVHENIIAKDRINDIALLTITAPGMNFYKYVKSVCLPRKYEFYNFRPCLIVGWDRTRFSQLQTGMIPIKAEVSIIDLIQCEEDLDDLEVASLGCAGLDKVADAVASRVVGWPLFCPSEDHSGQYYLQGIVSRNLTGHLLFTDVFKLQSWIHQKLESLYTNPSWYIPSFTSQYGWQSKAWVQSMEL